MGRELTDLLGSGFGAGDGINLGNRGSEKSYSWTNIKNLVPKWAKKSKNNEEKVLGKDKEFWGSKYTPEEKQEREHRKDKKLKEKLFLDEMYDLNITPFRKAAYTAGYKVKNALYKAGRFVGKGKLTAAMTLGTLVGSIAFASCANPLSVPKITTPKFSTEITADYVKENTTYSHEFVLSNATKVYLESSPSWMSASISGNTATVTGKVPNVKKDTPVEVSLVAEGNGGTAKEAYTLTIENVNDAPNKSTLSGPTSATAGSPLTFTVTDLSDPNSNEGDYVERADLYDNGKEITPKSFSQATSSTTFTENLSVGTHDLVAKIYDTFGAETDSNTLKVVVLDNSNTTGGTTPSDPSNPTLNVGSISLDEQQSGTVVLPNDSDGNPIVSYNFITTSLPDGTPLSTSTTNGNALNFPASGKISSNKTGIVSFNFTDSKGQTGTVVGREVIIYDHPEVEGTLGPDDSNNGQQGIVRLYNGTTPLIDASTGENYTLTYPNGGFDILAKNVRTSDLVKITLKAALVKPGSGLSGYFKDTDGKWKTDGSFIRTRYLDAKDQTVDGGVKAVPYDDLVGPNGTYSAEEFIELCRQMNFYTTAGLIKSPVRKIEIVTDSGVSEGYSFSGTSPIQTAAENWNNSNRSFNVVVDSTLQHGKISTDSNGKKYVSSVDNGWEVVMPVETGYYKIGSNNGATEKLGYGTVSYIDSLFTLTALQKLAAHEIGLAVSYPFEAYKDIVTGATGDTNPDNHISDQTISAHIIHLSAPSSLDKKYDLMQSCSNYTLGTPQADIQGTSFP